MDSRVRYYVQKYLGAKWSPAHREWIVSYTPRVTAHTGVTVCDKRPVVLTIATPRQRANMSHTVTRSVVLLSFEDVKTLGAIKALGIETMIEAAKGMHVRGEEKFQAERNLFQLPQ